MNAVATMQFTVNGQRRSVTTVTSHLEFPIWFWDLLFYDKGGALVDVVVRDAATVLVGVLAIVAWWQAGAADSDAELTVTPPVQSGRHGQRARSAGRL